MSKLRKPCKNCPWRKDAPRQYWDSTHFEEIWCGCQGDGMHLMLCHKANTLPKAKRGDLICQGWIRVMGFDAIGVRIACMTGKITVEEVEDTKTVDLFNTFAAMLRANKIKLPQFPRFIRP